MFYLILRFPDSRELRLSDEQPVTCGMIAIPIRLTSVAFDAVVCRLPVVLVIRPLRALLCYLVAFGPARASVDSAAAGEEGDRRSRRDQ